MNKPAPSIQSIWTLRRALTPQSRIAKMKRLGVTRLSGDDLYRVVASGPLDGASAHAAINAALKRERADGVGENRLLLAVAIEIAV